MPPLQYCSLCKIYSFNFCLQFVVVMSFKFVFVFGAGCNVLIQSGDDAIKY